MRGNTSIRQRSFPPTRQSMRNATRRTKARGVSNPYRAPRASRGNSITLGSAHPCSRCSLSLSKSPSSIPLSKSSSSISFAPSIRPILESPLVNSAHVLPSHSILQNFFFDQFCAGSTCLHPILDSPLEDSVSLLGLRRQAAQSQLVCGRRIRLTVVGAPPVSGLVGKNW